MTTHYEVRFIHESLKEIVTRSKIVEAATREQAMRIITKDYDVIYILAVVPVPKSVGKSSIRNK